MELRRQELSPKLAKVALSGRLDTPGVDAIEARFNAAVVAAGREVLVELTDVSFIASMGIRMLITVARAMRQKQLRLVLFGAQPLVRDTLQSMSIDSLIAIAADESAARAIVEG